jgi:uncharacterized protein involved in response to NO
MIIEVIEPQANRGAKEFALCNLGSRPCYLLASIFAVSSILLWICQYRGQLPAPCLRSPAWHGHEMLFGDTLAVVAGLLLTAVGNWTGKPTPSGGALLSLAALWVAGGVLVLAPYATAAAIANVAFPVALAVGIGKAVVQSRNRRNYFFSHCSCCSPLPCSRFTFHLWTFFHDRSGRGSKSVSMSCCSSWP